MANLRELRNRIASIKSTRKITSAMKMVAAARLRQSQQAITDSGYFTASLGRISLRLIKTISVLRAADIAHGKEPRYEMPRLITGDGEDKRHLVIIFSSSRGLCGGFNLNIAKKAAQFIEHLQSQGRIVRLICVGSKATELLRDRYGKQIVATFNSRVSPDDQLADAENMAMHLLSMFEKGTIDACSIVPLQAARILQPFTGENPWGFLMDDGAGNTFSLQRPTRSKSGALGKGKGIVRGVGARAKTSAQPYKTAQERRVLGMDAMTAEDRLSMSDADPAEYDYEPENPQDLLNALLPEILTELIFRSSLESAASENGARMTAMDNATGNAGDIIDDLTLLYNRTRQAMITNELTEIISGAEAL